MFDHRAFLIFTFFDYFPFIPIVSIHVIFTYRHISITVYNKILEQLSVKCAEALFQVKISPYLFVGWYNTTVGSISNQNKKVGIVSKNEPSNRHPNRIGIVE